MPFRRCLAIGWLVLGTMACGSSEAPPTSEPDPDSDVDAGAGAGGNGGTGGDEPRAPDASAAPSPTDAAQPSPVTDAPASPLPADAAAEPDVAPALGPFPLEAIKAARAEMYARVPAHVEGPSYRKGEVFVAADGQGMMRIDAARKVYRYHPRLAPVGAYLLADGSIIQCDHSLGVVQVFEDGKVAVLASRIPGQPAEFCNDLTVDRDGNIYLSYRRAGTIFRISPAGQAIKVAGGLGGANGVEVDPENKFLYVGLGGSLVRVALAEGAATELGKPETLLSLGRPDGMQFDIWGNLWIASYGGGDIVIYSPAQKRVLANLGPGGPPINLTFGGNEGDTLFIAVDFRGIYKLGPIPGLRGFLQPIAPKYQIERMLDLVPANQPVP